jgi:hypothetical protein
MPEKKTKTSSESEARNERQPYRVRLPGFVGEGKEVGLGDVIKRATYSAGIRPCAGCLQRAGALNRWIRFTR